jgi:hypothetical protein
MQLDEVDELLNEGVELMLNLVIPELAVHSAEITQQMESGEAYRVLVIGLNSRAAHAFSLYLLSHPDIVNIHVESAGIHGYAVVFAWRARPDTTKTNTLQLPECTY